MFSLGVLTALALLLLVAFVWQMSQQERPSLATPQATATPTPVQNVAAPVIVATPDVFGMTLEDATAALEAAGLQVGVVRYAHDAAVPAGLVLEQNPRADVQVVAGTAVDLIVSLGVPPQ